MTTCRGSSIRDPPLQEDILVVSLSNVSWLDAPNIQHIEQKDCFLIDDRKHLYKPVVYSSIRQEQYMCGIYC